jgi:hypothetical protein
MDKKVQETEEMEMEMVQQEMGQGLKEDKA